MLDIAFSIHGPAGWIDLEDPANGYEAHKDTRASQAVTWRKHEITSAYVEGTFVNEAVKENVTEALVVTVSGASHFELQTRVQAILDALSQLRYEVKARIGNAEETWTCSVADYTVESSQELLNSGKVIVRAQVPRMPTVTLLEV